MRVLVTGGAGFIGSHVAELLLARGEEVHILDDLSNGHRANVPDGAELYEGSLTDAGFVTATFALVRPEAVCHLAAQVSVIDSLKDPLDDLRRNVVGGLNLLLAARSHGQPKLVYSSTGGAIYGDPQPSDLPVAEDYPCRPLSPYGLSKYVFERYLELEHRLHGQPHTVLRFSNVFGPRQDPHGEAGVVAIFTRRLLQDQVCTVYGDGEQTRDFAYVGDVARAVVAGLARADGETINIGTGVETTVNEVVAALEAAWGKPFRVEHAPERPGEVRRSALNVSKAAAALDWRPEVSFREGIARTLEHYRGAR